jgi:hypothetical protein
MRSAANAANRHGATPKKTMCFPVPGRTRTNDRLLISRTQFPFSGLVSSMKSKQVFDSAALRGIDRKGTEGSNPSCSAIPSGSQRNLALFLRKSLENAAILRFSPRNPTVLLNPASEPFSCFPWRAHAQSGFIGSIRRTQYDHRPTIRQSEDGAPGLSSVRLC